MKNLQHHKNIFWLFVFSLLIVSCKKVDLLASTGGSPSYLEKYFEDNVINKDFIVNRATNNGVDLTGNYSGYTFRLLKTDYYKGPLEARKGSNIYSGTWSSNSDYSKLIITLPSSPSEFVFLTREWRFTSKALPQLELAPWGSTEPLVLHMLRQ